MVFHLGMLWRLYDTGLLSGIKRISSVSGGSITAGVLGLKWRKLSFDPARVKTDFVPEVVTPVRTLASKSIDIWSVVLGALLPSTAGDRIAAAYDKHLFRGATLQDLPDEPRFVINATSVQSGALWRFSKPYMRDYRVGEVKSPTVPLARAVAASSAFPPFLSPLELQLDPTKFTPDTGDDLQCEPFISKAILTDGGVYDNLGLETAWKNYETILVSDGGGKMDAEGDPANDWVRHSLRVLNMIDNQVRSLRKRQVIDSYDAKTRKGAYWGIRTDIAKYELAETLPCPHARTMALADIPTRLAALDDIQQERLINWGYAVCDAALRKHVDPELPTPTVFPYQAAGV